MLFEECCNFYPNNLDIVLLIIGIQIEGLCKLVLMTKTKLFESYEKMIVGRLMFLSHSNLFYIHVTFSAKKRDLYEL